MASQEIVPVEIVQAFLTDKARKGLTASAQGGAAVVPGTFGNYEPVPVQTTNVATVQQGASGTYLRVVEATEFHASSEALATEAYNMRLAHQRNNQETDRAADFEDKSVHQSRGIKNGMERSGKRRYGWRVVLALGMVGIGAYGAGEVYDLIYVEDANFADFRKSILENQFGAE